MVPPYHGSGGTPRAERKSVPQGPGYAEPSYEGTRRAEPASGNAAEAVHTRQRPATAVRTPQGGGYTGG